MLGEVRVLEKDDVIVGSRRRDRIPYACEGILEILGLELDVEGPGVIRWPDAGTR
jgi:hypothetical protein